MGSRVSIRNAAGQVGFCKVVARLLLGMAALVLLLSPYTEGLRGIDVYPLVGQDFELSMFVVLILLCMTILAVFFGIKLIQQLLNETSREGQAIGIKPSKLLKCVHVDAAVWIPPRQFATPLQI